MMERDYTTSSSSGETVYGGTGTMGEEKQIGDYMSDLGDTVSSGAGQVTEFLMERPLLVGSIIFGAMGAFIGSRLANTIAMRRRRTVYDRAMDTIGLFVAALGTMFSQKNMARASRRLSATRRDILGTTQDWSQTISDRAPMDRIRVREQPSAFRQIGYALSLIPITMALVRNPLIRYIGFRFVARRMRFGRH